MEKVEEGKQEEEINIGKKVLYVNSFADSPIESRVIGIDPTIGMLIVSMETGNPVFCIKIGGGRIPEDKLPFWDMIVKQIEEEIVYAPIDSDFVTFSKEELGWGDCPFYK